MSWRVDRGVVVGLAFLSLTLGGCGGGRETPPPSEPPAAGVDTTGIPDAAPLPDSVEFVARGNEPFWAITVFADGILFQEPDRIEGVRGPAGVPIRRDSLLIFRTTLRDSVPIPLELTLEEKHCQDSMSGFSFPYTATAQVGERRFEGCGERRPRTRTGAIGTKP